MTYIGKQPNAELSAHLPFFNMTVWIAGMVYKASRRSLATSIHNFTRVILEKIVASQIRVNGAHAFDARVLRNDFTAVLCDKCIRRNINISYTQKLNVCDRIVHFNPYPRAAVW